MTLTLDRGYNTATSDLLQTNQLIAVPVLYLDFYDPSVTEQIQRYYAGSSNNIKVSGFSTIIPDGTYIGVGGISSVSTVEEASELKATKLSVELNGLDSTYMATVLALQYFGREAKLALVLLDSDYKIATGTEPILLFKGFMSILSTELTQGGTKVMVEIESILADWERPRVKRYNTLAQKDIDGTDTGFDGVAELINKDLVWG